MAAIRRGDTRRRSGLRIATLIIGVLTLLPVGYLFNALRASTEEAMHVNAVQRAGAGYMRPLTTLLAALVDAQGAAVRAEPIGIDTVRSAIDQVSQVDKAWGDQLAARQRWSQLRAEIETALGRAASGPDAIGAYAEPIGLTQALFSRIGDTSMIARNPGVDAQYLIDTAVAGVPEVVINAGQVAWLARTAAAADPRMAVALDRITRAAQAIRAGPHPGADQTAAGPATTGMLEPLDEFTAAVDGLVQAASVPHFTAGQPLADLDRALRRVRQAAMGLDVAVLDAVDVLLGRRLLELDAQRRNMVIAGVLILTAAAVLPLLWFGSDAANRRPASRPERPARADRPAGPRHLEHGHLEQERAGSGLAGVGRSAHLRPGETR